MKRSLRRLRRLADQARKEAACKGHELGPFEIEVEWHAAVATCKKCRLLAAIAFFEYREDAVQAGREWVEPQGWIVRPQYVGRYDLWMLFAKRKSWGYRLAEIPVEACRNPEAVVTRHAHVPAQHAYRQAVTA